MKRQSSSSQPFAGALMWFHFTAYRDTCLQSDVCAAICVHVRPRARQ